MMNGLTVNLHLMLTSFYRPTSERYRILIERPCFSSDRYVVETQIRMHGLDPQDALVEVGPRPGEDTLRDEDLLERIEREGASLAMIMLGGVNFLTGQLFDLGEVARAGRTVGSVVGYDLAHAVGNVPLRLHDWGVDFAVWCNYKYVNAGPGAVAGCFVHERHAAGDRPERLGGWWGTDPASRFKLQLLPDFVPQPGAPGWQLSNPPILSMAPLEPALALFAEATMEGLRDKSVALTSYTERLLQDISARRFRVITPEGVERRGCQLSLLVEGDARSVERALAAEGVVCDFREPDVIRVAPVPLYNTFHDAWRFARALSRA